MRRLGGIVSILLASGTALAHDFWIEPSRFQPMPGELVKLELLVGERLAGEAVPRNDAWIDRFEAVRDGAASRVVGVDGSDPAGLIRPDTPGRTLVVYTSRPSYVEVEAPKFEAYLQAEGLDAPRAARARTRSGATPGRERFSRCAKALLAVGGASRSGAATAPAGLPLELVAESDPYALQPGDNLTVRLLYLGRPLAGALVKATDRERPGEPVAVRTDAVGRASLALPRAGAWLIHAVHMVPVTGDARADWESFWASLTFELPGTR